VVGDLVAGRRVAMGFTWTLERDADAVVDLEHAAADYDRRGSLLKTDMDDSVSVTLASVIDDDDSVRPCG